MTRTLSARGGTFTLGEFDGASLLRGLLPFLALLFLGCAKPTEPAETRKLESVGLAIETPAGWTGGGAGGTYEYRSADGTGRVRVARLEGATSPSALKESQLLTGTGAQATSKLFPTSPTKIGALVAERARFSASDGRVYDVVAVQTPHGVLLVQTSVTAERLTQDAEGTERLFTSVRQSIKLL
jgi:hypothetical protein